MIKFYYYLMKKWTKKIFKKILMKKFLVNYQKLMINHKKFLKKLKINLKIIIMI